MVQSKEKNKRALPPTYLFLALVVIVVLHFLLPGKQIIAFPWNILGIFPVIVGSLFNLAADKALKKHETTVKPFQKSTALITDGVYGISRHPMYLGFVLILGGVVVLLGSLTPYIVVVLFPILMEGVFIRIEEKMLEEQFGERWSSYKAKVRRWV
ncbi:MAG TPA: isoprenylcysteine carboxylmethyltransferase family protein [Bacteroidetes bacterium]|nr:isoprenylcysteine carboxylmethyltransferase family protein [Bacteroidota bacterium]